MFYTRKGDDGESNLLDCKRLSKDAPIFEALGALDELNSYLGVCKAFAHCLKVRSDMVSLCEELQQHLFIIQAELAGADKNIKYTHVVWLEEVVDKIEQKLPPIKNFLISGATPLSAHFDYARTLARRAERRVICLGKEKNINEYIKVYMNRVSSVLYAFARLSAHKSGADESAPLY